MQVIRAHDGSENRRISLYIFPMVCFTNHIWFWLLCCLVIEKNSKGTQHRFWFTRYVIFLFKQSTPTGGHSVNSRLVRCAAKASRGAFHKRLDENSAKAPRGTFYILCTCFIPGLQNAWPPSICRVHHFWLKFEAQCVRRYRGTSLVYKMRDHLVSVEFTTSYGWSWNHNVYESTEGLLIMCFLHTNPYTTAKHFLQ